jgi:hypothetical protein
MTGSILKDATVIWQQLQEQNGEQESLPECESSCGLFT